MTYLDPASNPRSKPQRLCATNCKSSTPDKLQIFRTIFGISCKYLTKNYLHEITLFVLFWRGILCKRNHRTFQESKKKNQWFERKCPVLMAAWLNPTESNLVIHKFRILTRDRNLKLVYIRIHFVSQSPRF